MWAGSTALWDLRLGIDAADRAYLGTDIVWPRDAWPLTRPAVKAWWRADFPSTIDRDTGGKVSAWRDCKNQYELVQASADRQPTWSATSFAGTPGITFSSVLQTYLTLASSPWPINALSSMMVIVCDQLTPASTTSLKVLAAYGDGPNGQRKATRSVQAGINRGGFQIGNGFSTDLFEQARVNFTGRHSLVIWFGDVSSTAGLDDSVFSGVSSFALRTTAGRTRIGANASASAAEFCDAIIRDVLILEGALLSPTDFVDFQAWAFGRTLQ